MTTMSDRATWNANDTNDGNVNDILWFFSIINTTLSADCRPRVTITTSGDSTYEAGDVLTCAADGSNPTYAWSGINGGSTFSSTSSTVTLLEGEFCLICTATLNSDAYCSARAFLCDSALSKYHTLVALFMQTSLSVDRWLIITALNFEHWFVNFTTCHDGQWW